MSTSSGKEQGSNRDETADASTKCMPCREGCSYCRDDAPCLVHEDGPLRLTLASFQGLCMVLDLASMVLVYHFRRKKVKGDKAVAEEGCRMQIECCEFNST